MTMYKIANLFNYVDNPLTNNDWMLDFYPNSGGRKDYSPQDVNIYESPTDLKFRFDIPGYKKEDIKIELMHSTLSVSGKRKIEIKDDAKPYYKENVESEFKKSYKLPSTIDADSHQAKYQDGVLEIVFNKAKETMAKQIELN